MVTIDRLIEALEWAKKLHGGGLEVKLLLDKEGNDVAPIKGLHGIGNRMTQNRYVVISPYEKEGSIMSKLAVSILHKKGLF